MKKILTIICLLSTCSTAAFADPCGAGDYTKDVLTLNNQIVDLAVQIREFEIKGILVTDDMTSRLVDLKDERCQKHRSFLTCNGLSASTIDRLCN